MARYDPQHKIHTRERILHAADRLIKARGVAPTTVDAVMQEAGLTVGGFYAHFGSKEALAREALLFGLDKSVCTLLASLAAIDDPQRWVRALIRKYLAQAEDAALENACPLTLMLPDVARDDRNAQNAFALTTSRLLDRIAASFPEVSGMSRRDAALAVYTGCIGAVTLARAVPAADARQRILRTTERTLLRMLGIPDEPAAGADQAMANT